MLECKTLSVVDVTSSDSLLDFKRSLAVMLLAMSMALADMWPTYL
jgi:hypothetical protein